MTKKINTLFQKLESLDNKSIQFLMKAISENNLPGFDYLEFKQSLNALKEMEMEETMAIKSAFTTGSTVGLTKSKLIASAEHYKKVLLTEKGQFDSALQKQMDQKVYGKKQEKEVLTKKIEQYKSKISQLEIEIQKYQEKLDKADSEISTAKSKIEETRDKFEATLNTFVDQINGDISKLKAVL
jgi:chromosome segregation ATPase